MPLVYLSYAWSETGMRRPPWTDALIKALGPKYHFYDPGLPFEDQLTDLEKFLPAIPNTPPIILQMLGLPVESLLNVSDEVRGWGKRSDYRHKVWADLFVLLRASITLVDLNIRSRNQQSMDLVLSYMKGIPVIGISDLEYVPHPVAYCCTMVLPSYSDHLAEIVYRTVPPETENGQDAATGPDSADPRSGPCDDHGGDGPDDLRRQADRGEPGGTGGP